MAKETIITEILIIGGGIAGLSAAIRAKQLSPSTQITVLEKGSEIGAHIISGAVFNPIALNELLPSWQEMNSPIATKATDDEFSYFTKEFAYKLPIPKYLKNHGNYIISLGNLCRWLGSIAESLGVEIFAGFAAKEAIFEKDRLVGVVTGDFGIAKDGSHKPNYQPGVEIRANQIIIAEGARGYLAEQLIQRYSLRKEPQTYGLGIKEIWQISPEKHHQGKVSHSIGWPLEDDIYGGSFIYHAAGNQLYTGFVIGLDYPNPYTNPYEEYQLFKNHPSIKPLLEGGNRISYGAKVLNEGGYQSLPSLCFPGGMIIGCSAGFLNVPKIKGSHYAMKSGILAAESIINGGNYEELVKKSWIYKELWRSRNIRPAFRAGTILGLCYSAVDNLLHGYVPWTFSNQIDNERMMLASNTAPKYYPSHNGVTSFDLLSSLYYSNTNHEENQPSHLLCHEFDRAGDLYNSPEIRYCPAGVYELHGTNLHINAQNCLHCKTCDIKGDHLIWSPPEGGGGPNYVGM